MRNVSMMVAIAAATLVSSLPAQAALATVDCGKKGKVQAAIDKFDKSVANVLTVIGACVETVLVSGHRDLTIAGGAGASLTVSSQAEAALDIRASRVTVQNLSVNGNALANTGVSCNDRSVCILENVSVSGAQFTGIGAQKQSSVDVIGSPTTVISGNAQAGIGVAGQSSMNISSAGGFDLPGVTITGNGTGIDAIDGSFMRVENAQIVNNTTGGIAGNRGVVFKVFGTTIANNGGPGIFMRASNLQTGPQFSQPLNIVNNAGPGVLLRHLSYGQVVVSALSGNGGGYPNGVDCASTAALRTDGTTRAASNPACLAD